MATHCPDVYEVNFAGGQVTMKNIPVRHIKTTLREPGISGSFSIMNVKAMLNGSDMVQELHRHDFFFILALQKGTGYHSIDFIPYKVGRYTVFLMRPGQVHQLTLKAGSTGWLVQFNTDFFSTQNKPALQLLNKLSHKNFCELDMSRFKKLEQVLTYIFDEYSVKEEGYLDVIKSGLHIFFTGLIRSCQNNEMSSGNKSPYNQEQLEKFSALLEIHLTDHKQVSQYAEMMHLSVYQLNAVTKITLNKTPSELINEHIILEAKRRLLATSGRVNQIADELGYKDVSYFIRFFKKHTGHSPEAFRDNFR